MPKLSQPFDADALSDLFCVSREVVNYWWDTGVGPEFFERQTADGVKRFAPPEAVNAFILKHCVMRGYDGVASGAPSPSAADQSLIIGGALTPAGQA